MIKFNTIQQNLVLLNVCVTERLMSMIIYERTATFLARYRILEIIITDRPCSLAVTVPGYRSRVPGSIRGTTTFSE
jgi:hypothetical protein